MWIARAETQVPWNFFYYYSSGDSDVPEGWESLALAPYNESFSCSKEGWSHLNPTTLYSWGNWDSERLNNSRWEEVLRHGDVQSTFRVTFFITMPQFIIMNSTSKEALQWKLRSSKWGHPVVSGSLHSFSLPTSCFPCVGNFPAAPRQITNCGYSEVPCYFHWFLLNAACGSDSRMCKPI